MRLDLNPALLYDEAKLDLRVTNLTMKFNVTDEANHFAGGKQSGR